MISAHPGQLDMDRWFGMDDHPYPSDFDIAREERFNPVHNCGTTACIGGWAVALNPPGKNEEDPEKGYHFALFVYDRAIDLLQITEEQAEALFHAEQWPDPFCGQYYGADTPEARAKAAVARIGHFIATEGKK